MIIIIIKYKRKNEKIAPINEAKQVGCGYIADPCDTLVGAETAV